MNIFKFSLFHMLVFSLNSWATSFIPVSVEVQLKESDAVVYGIYKGHIFKKGQSGILTVASFQVNKIAGIKHNELINKNEILVNYPGGEWGNTVYTVHGTPSFTMGEEVILLLNKSGDGLTLHNLSLGKYNIITKDGIKKVVSSVFPTHAQFGEISFEKFDNLVFQKIGERLRVVSEDKKVVIDDSKNYKRYWVKRKSISRNISSVNENNNEKQNEKNQIFWPLFVLSLMSIFSAILGKRNG